MLWVIQLNTAIMKIVATICLLVTVFTLSCAQLNDEKLSVDNSGVTAETRNPLSDTDSAIAAGQPLFVTNCSTCHGPEGKGDGASGLALPKRPHDLTSDDVSNMSDGQIFLVLKNGKMRDGSMTMPPIRRLSNDQMWQIIAYARTLKNARISERP